MSMSMTKQTEVRLEPSDRIQDAGEFGYDVDQPTPRVDGIVVGIHANVLDDVAVEVEAPQRRPKRRMNNPYATARAAPGKPAMHVAEFTKLPDASGAVSILDHVQSALSRFAASGIHGVASAFRDVCSVPFPAVAALQPRHARGSVVPAGAIKIIIGQLPQGVPPAFVEAMIWLASGCRVYDVSVHNTDPKVGRGRSFSSYAFAWVARADFVTVVAAVHKRVLIDRRGWLVAVTAEGVDSLDRFCDMIGQKRNDACRLQCAPYKCVYIVRATGEPSTTDDEYHPLCGCHSCAGIVAATTTPEFVSAFLARRNALMARTPSDQVAWLRIESHMKSPELIESKLQAVRDSARGLWPQWQTAQRWCGPRDDAGRVNGIVVAHQPRCARAAAN